MNPMAWVHDRASATARGDWQFLSAVPPTPRRWGLQPHFFPKPCNGHGTWLAFFIDVQPTRRQALRFNHTD